MRRLLFALFLAGAFLLPTASAAEAQGVRAGVHGLYASRTFGEAWGVGGQLGVDLPKIPVQLLGNFDYFWPFCPAGSGTCESWSGVLNVVFMEGRTGPYFGAGAVYNQSQYPGVADDGETTETIQYKDWAFDITLGVVLDFLPVFHPVLDFRYEWYFGDAQDQLVFGLGFLY